MHADCQHADDVAAYLSDELAPAGSLEFEQHLAGCAECRAAASSTRALFSQLHAVPRVEAGRDLAPLLLAQIQAPVRPPRRWIFPTAAAAALALLVTGAALFERPGQPAATVAGPVDENAASVARALAWFCRHQEHDGSWDAAKWGGNPRFEVALTALPLIALLEGDLTPERTAAATRAASYIQHRQQPDGTFCRPFRESPYIQSVSTLALLQAYGARPDPGLRRTLDSALRVILATQDFEGGWGYASSPGPSYSITLWHKSVVELATELGWDEARPSLARVNDWLAAQPIPALPAAPVADRGADFHHAYFAASRLRQQGTPEALHQLAMIQHNLVDHQDALGEESGTWTPTDQWGRVGGRIYATALATLALH